MDIINDWYSIRGDILAFEISSKYPASLLWIINRKELENGGTRVTAQKNFDLITKNMTQ